MFVYVSTNSSVSPGFPVSDVAVAAVPSVMFATVFASVFATTSVVAEAVNGDPLCDVIVAVLTVVPSASPVLRPLTVSVAEPPGGSVPTVAVTVWPANPAPLHVAPPATAHETETIVIPAGIGSVSESAFAVTFALGEFAAVIV
jgi:hypothetical protein